MLLLRLIPFLKAYRLRIILAFGSALIVTILQLAVPEIIRLVIDIGLAEGQVRFLLVSALALLGIGSLRAVLLFSQRYLSESIAARIGFDLRNRLYDHIQHLSFSFHDHTQTGQLISRVIEDTRSIERFTGFGVIELIRVLLLLVGITTLLFIQQPLLASIALLPVLVLILLTINFGRRIGNLFFDVDTTLGDLSARLQENVSGVQVVRAFARESHEIERFDGINRLLYQARVNVINTFSRIMPTTHLLIAIGTILVLWVGGEMALRGRMTVGEVVAFNAYLLLLAIPARQLAWLVNIAGEAAAGLRRNLEVLDRQPEIKSSPHAIQLPVLSGEVIFEDVCFRYEGQKTPALDDINLKVEPNQIIALIGPTGSGKTSLVNLIPRFYETTHGVVKVDGYDVRHVELVSLRRQIGIVLQTSLLFSITIAENIAYGRPDARQDEIEAAARAAQAHDFILELPQGYQTVVGERGITLSGGQRQRIAIARALLMDPRILILDDSTSSVDTETERLIQQALDEMMQGRTTFVIAHRLATVRRADMILVMQDGRIVERGLHQELIQRDGLYRQIYDLQLRDQEQFREEMETLSGSTTPAIEPGKSRNWESA